MSLTPEEREALAELATLYSTFLLGRWAEVMACDDEPADDWQEQAALEAVDLFAPAAVEALNLRAAVALSEAVALVDRAANEQCSGCDSCDGNTRHGLATAARIVRAAIPPP